MQELGKMNREGGFTLIEMMVVGAIISIGTIIAIPGYTQWNAKYQLKQAAMEVTNQLAVARFAAMNQNTRVRVTTTVASSQLNIAFTNSAGSQVLSPQTLGVPHVVTIGGTTQIDFNSLGLRATSGASQTMTLTNDKGLTYSVVVPPGGKAAWCPKSSCP